MHNTIVIKVREITMYISHQDIIFIILTKTVKNNNATDDQNHSLAIWIALR